MFKHLVHVKGAHIYNISSFLFSIFVLFIIKKHTIHPKNSENGYTNQTPFIFNIGIKIKNPSIMKSIPEHNEINIDFCD